MQPSQTLEKSLKEHIQRTAGLANWENKTTAKDEAGAASKSTASSSSKKSHKKDKRKAPSSKEASPSELRISSSNIFSVTLLKYSNFNLETKIIAFVRQFGQKITLYEAAS